MSRVAPQEVYQRQVAAPKDPKHLAKVAMLPCVICDGWGMQQLSRTTVHHHIMGRYGTLKTPDGEAIPLCEGHHQGDFDTSKIALHRDPDMWRDHYGLDTDFVAATIDAVERMDGFE